MLIKDDKLYMRIRFFIVIVIPAFITCYNTIGLIWHIGYTKEITATLTAIQVFLGSCIEISNKNYRENKEKKDENN